MVQAECSGKAQECQMICNTDKIHPSTCATTCNAYYQCGTDKAPPSYLQTENPSDVPSYNGPPKTLDGASDTSGIASNTTQSSSSNSTHIRPIYLFLTLALSAFTSSALF